MTWDVWFSIANFTAIPGWIVLILGPRRFLSLNLLVRLGIPLVLSLGYTCLILIYFAGAEGGFDSLSNVRLLLSGDGMLLGGWVHYLAFDLFVGGWLAARMDAAKIHRVIQAPILFLTFMLGPIGFVLGLILATDRQNVTASLKEMIQ